MSPPPPDTVIVNPAPANTTMKPGVDAPPLGMPQTNYTLPAPPLPQSVPVALAISPGTIREELTDKNAIKTTVTLSAPATKDTLFHIVTDDPQKMACSDIFIPKGYQQEDGTIKINWYKVLHNCGVSLKAFTDQDPDTLLHARVYLRKKIE